MVGSAVVLQRMSGLVVRVIEDKGQRLSCVRGLERIAELARETLRADHLEICRTARAGPTPRKVSGRSAPDHVLIDLADDGIDGHRRVIGVPARAEEASLFAGVTDEQNGTPRAWSARKLLRDLENGHRPASVVVGAIANRVESWRVHFAQTVED